MILWPPSLLLLRQHRLALNPLNRCKQRCYLRCHSTFFTFKLCTRPTVARLLNWKYSHIFFYNLDCTCRLDGHHTSLQTSWLQSLTLEQWLPPHGTEPLLLQWRSCTVESASSLYDVVQYSSDRKIAGAFCHPLRFGFRLCFAWAEKETFILFHPSHILLQRDGQKSLLTVQVKWSFAFALPWYLCLLSVGKLVMIIVYFARRFSAHFGRTIAPPACLSRSRQSTWIGTQPFCITENLFFGLAVLYTSRLE